MADRRHHDYSCNTGIIMPPSTRLRTGRNNRRTLNTNALVQALLKEQSKPKQWEGWAHLATVAAAVAAVVALLSGTYQFAENTKLQHEALALQAATVKTDRSSKAAEFFDRFYQVHSVWDPPKEKNSIDYYIRVRDNKALQLLNAVFSVSEGDEKWRSLVYWELQNFRHIFRERQTMCLSLTDDFYRFIQKSVTGLPSNICYDTYASE